MKNELNWFSKVRLLISVSALYVMPFGIVWFSLQTPSSQPTVHATGVYTHRAAKEIKPEIITGQPVRIVVDNHGIDLAVDQGSYSDDGGWTLSDINAQYANISYPPNDQSGNTFIYGHATDAVFGPLASSPPTLGSTATVYTNNGHTFIYEFIKQQDFSPTETGIFQYDGPPILTIQTCTGPFSEFRTFYQYKFKQVT